MWVLVVNDTETIGNFDSLRTRVENFFSMKGQFSFLMSMRKM